MEHKSYFSICSGLLCSMNIFCKYACIISCQHETFFMYGANLWWVICSLNFYRLKKQVDSKEFIFFCLSFPPCFSLFFSFSLFPQMYAIFTGMKCILFTMIIALSLCFSLKTIKWSDRAGACLQKQYFDLLNAMKTHLVQTKTKLWRKVLSDIFKTKS